MSILKRTGAVEQDIRAPGVSGVKISPITSTKMEGNTETSTSAIWAVNDADSRANGEESQMRNLFCLLTSLSLWYHEKLTSFGGDYTYIPVRKIISRVLHLALLTSFFPTSVNMDLHRKTFKYPCLSWQFLLSLHICTEIHISVQKRELNSHIGHLCTEKRV